MLDSLGTSTSHTYQNIEAANTASPHARTQKDIAIDGQRYRMVIMAFTYAHSQAHTSRNGAPVDRGTNGRIFGSDVRINLTTSRSVDI